MIFLDLLASCSFGMAYCPCFGCRAERIERQRERRLLLLAVP